MAFLTLDQIKEVEDIKQHTVEVPEWGGDIMIKGMSGRLRSNLEQKISNNAPINDVKMIIVTTCCIKEDGKPLFASSDRKWLAEKAAAPLETIFDAICKLSGIGLSADEDAEGN